MRDIVRENRKVNSTLSGILRGVYMQLAKCKHCVSNEPEMSDLSKESHLTFSKEKHG